MDCGGGECKLCDIGDTCVRATDCKQGTCVGEFCQDARCGNGMRDKGEADVDCGGFLCRPCRPGGICENPGDCDSGVCQDTRCAVPSCSDGTLNGDEIALDCGGDCPGCAPGTPCRNPSDCSSGACESARCTHSCDENEADCDGEFGNACETNIATDPLHCGACATPCQPPNTVPECVDGVCGFSVCEPGFADCNEDKSDGCEVDIARDPKNCGACASACSENHAMADCRDGTCALTCDPGYDDCDHADTNGCETSLADDIDNCGHCGTTCPSEAERPPVCRASVCG